MAGGPPERRENRMAAAYRGQAEPSATGRGASADRRAAQWRRMCTAMDSKRAEACRSVPKRAAAALGGNARRPRILSQSAANAANIQTRRRKVAAKANLRTFDSIGRRRSGLIMPTILTDLVPHGKHRENRKENRQYMFSAPKTRKAAPAENIYCPLFYCFTSRPVSALADLAFDPEAIAHLAP